MAHFAELDANNVVLRVIVVSDDNEADGENFCHMLLGGRWKQTSYNTQRGVHYLPNSNTPSNAPMNAGRRRKNYAGIGYTYDEARDAFLPPSPFPSWIVDDVTGTWHAPIPKPTDPLPPDFYYEWNEAAGRWVRKPY